MLARPNFSPQDLLNNQTISADFGLSEPVQINWLLYVEPNWKNWQKVLIEMGLTKYENGYEGYALYFDFTWTGLLGPYD